jgi:hypothetical protein
MAYGEDVEKYLSSIENPERREDITELVKLIARISMEEPKMWGSIIGFGVVHYKYASGHEGDTMIIGLASRKQAITLYGLVYYDKNHEHLSDLGQHSVGKGCLYIKRLSDIDIPVLEKMIEQAWKNPVLGS